MSGSGVLRCPTDVESILLSEDRGPERDLIGNEKRRFPMQTGVGRVTHDDLWQGSPIGPVPNDVDVITTGGNLGMPRVRRRKDNGCGWAPDRAVVHRSTIKDLTNDRVGVTLNLQ